MARPLADSPDGALSRIYDDLTRLLSGSSCPRSTRCCRFARTGRTPYLWPVEARRVLVGIARRGGRLPREGSPGDCPLLLKDGACAVYEDRPFGCRTYFCRDATVPPGAGRSEIEQLARELRAVAEREESAELVPLTTWLEQSFDRDGRPRRGGRQP